MLQDVLPQHKDYFRLIGTADIGEGLSLVAQMVKNLPAMREMWIGSLGWKDLWEEDLATHCSILAWRIPWTEQPGRIQSIGLHRVGSD